MKSTDYRCDWAVNNGRRRIQLLLFLFRFAQHVHSSNSPKVIRKAISALYRFISLNFYAIDIPVHTRIGRRLRIHHGFGLVINAATVVGADVELRHSTTLGSRQTNADCPEIADGVSVGPQTAILGAVRVGAGARVGAGSVVLHDVEAGATVAGSPARNLKP